MDFIRIVASRSSLIDFQLTLNYDNMNREDDDDDQRQCDKIGRFFYLPGNKILLQE